MSPSTVHGSPGHSSRPQSACNAVTGALEIVRRLTEGLRFTASHPALGTPTLAVNRIRSYPESTHTIQDRCEIGIDRRLMPGEDPDAAVAEIAAIASDRGRREGSRERQALARRGGEGAVHVPVAGRRFIRSGRAR